MLSSKNVSMLKALVSVAPLAWIWWMLMDQFSDIQKWMTRFEDHHRYLGLSLCTCFFDGRFSLCWHAHTIVQYWLSHTLLNTWQLLLCYLMQYFRMAAQQSHGPAVLIIMQLIAHGHVYLLQIDTCTLGQHMAGLHVPVHPTVSCSVEMDKQSVATLQIHNCRPLFI